MKERRKQGMEKLSVGALRTEMVLLIGVIGLCVAKAGSAFLI